MSREVGRERGAQANSGSEKFPFHLPISASPLFGGKACLFNGKTMSFDFRLRRSNYPSPSDYRVLREY
jgi:hypothetical protein